METTRIITSKRPTQLNTIRFNGTTYFIDFRLGEIREANRPLISIPFEDLTQHAKAMIRGIRTAYTSYGYIEGLDD